VYFILCHLKFLIIIYVSLEQCSDLQKLLSSNNVTKLLSIKDVGPTAFSFSPPNVKLNDAKTLVGLNKARQSDANIMSQSMMWMAPDDGN
jgi:hypothetical protein